MRAAQLLVVTLLAAACGPGSQDGTCKDNLLSGDLVITEVFADYQGMAGGTGADEGKEWIEIYNASDRAVELKGMTVVHGRPDDTKQKSHIMDDVTVAPGQFFTLGNSTQDLLPAYIDYGYSADLGDLFNTDGGKFDLKCGDQTIDSAVYDEVQSGHSRQLTSAMPPDYTINDELTNWCEARGTEFEAGNFGTPGQDNDCTPVVIGQCTDGGATRNTVPPEPGDLVITEVMPKPRAVSATTGQWFEIRATKDVDLNGVGLDRASDTAKPTLIESATCLRLTTGSYAVFARADTENGNLTIKGTFPFSINPASIPGDVQLVYGNTIIDAVSWPASTSGHSLSLDPDFESASGNDAASNFCDGVTQYNQDGTDIDYGTPGVANPQCVTQPLPGQCLDTGTPRAIVKPAVGSLVITEFLANAAGSENSPDSTQEFFEIKNTGAAAFDLNGLGLQGNSMTVNLIQSVDCKPVAAGAYALFAHVAEGNGGLPPIDGTFTFALAQSNGSIKVLDGVAVIDAITWTTGILDGASKQLQPAMTTSTANDDPANFCNALPTQEYGTFANLGTPKAVNVCTP